jgi:hypothetical protein
MPGQNLTEFWFTMDDATKHYYVSRIVDICKELAPWKGNSIKGVDGKELLKRFLLRSQAAPDFTPQNLVKSCQEVGMDCSTCLLVTCPSGLEALSRSILVCVFLW